MKSLPSGKRTEELYKKGKRLVSTEMVLIFQEKKEGRESEIGVHAGKKIGKANDRNKIKRRIRAALRSTGADEIPFDGIFIPRSSIKEKTFSEISNVLISLVSKLKKSILNP